MNPELRNKIEDRYTTLELLELLVTYRLIDLEDVLDAFPREVTDVVRREGDV